jgi:hypothetical protein
VPKKEDLKKKILDEAHTSRYSIHPGSTKMYHDSRQLFWWTRMKRETGRYALESDTCRKVKDYYMKPGVLLQPLNIPDSKWDDISMDFIVRLPLTTRKSESIWVIIDRLIKFAHLIPINTCDVGCGPIFSMNMTMGVKITCEMLTNSPAVPLLPMQHISTLWIFSTPHTCARSRRP